eukprot:1157834-Pelagomonas_calceolata.AAC.7
MELVARKMRRPLARSVRSTFRSSGSCVERNRGTKGRCRTSQTDCNSRGLAAVGSAMTNPCHDRKEMESQLICFQQWVSDLHAQGLGRDWALWGRRPAMRMHHI